MAMIDWDASERYHTSMPSSKRVKISKYVHEWQNVWAQKHKIATTQRKQRQTHDNSTSAQHTGVD